ncbi:MAG: hypothetical protein IJW16_06160 [Clostridia bacterium]|nr:hypothetical protein [Clostridia bacterium]
MKIKRYLPLALSILAIVLELLPFGAVCLFANPEGPPLRETYSYFDLTPFGYANFAPFCTALLTCVVTVLAIMDLVFGKKGARTAMPMISLWAALVSLAPLLLGGGYFTPLAAVISVTLFLLFAASLLVRLRAS